MRKVILALLIFLLIFSSFGCSPKETKLSNLTKVTLMLDWTPNTNHTGIYVALDKGYFKERNLDVTVVQPSEVWPEQAVSGGKADFGISFQESLTQYVVNEGAPLVAISAILQHDTSGLIWLKDSGITSPKDFANKTYGGWGSAWENAIVDYVAKENGVDPSTIKKVELGVFDQITGLQKKVYDFTWVYYGWEGIDAELRGLKFDFYSLRDHIKNFDHYTPIFITSKSMIENHPEIVKAFVEAISQGYTYAAKNPDEAAKILLKYAPELDKNLVMKSQEWISPYYLDESGCFGVMKESIFRNFTDLMYNLGIIKSKVNDVNTLFTNEFLPCKK
ncbi:MAG: ABC transporter substrate-binding protein [Caldisericum exile]|uniref:ABC transporter substrate-binding protein n=1 Tax=Caldisericum exile TaxID=693075 RepID=A0A2J6X8X0_9BACT|nr:MAG: ABC transporter substrate-binding protein [Caldisericum exile]HEM55965.1 ABC transporter substrate-binding protein [Thermodesulfobium narugense]